MFWRRKQTQLDPSSIPDLPGGWRSTDVSALVGVKYLDVVITSLEAPISSGTGGIDFSAYKKLAAEGKINISDDDEWPFIKHSVKCSMKGFTAGRSQGIKCEIELEIFDDIHYEYYFMRHGAIGDLVFDSRGDLFIPRVSG